MIHAFPLLLRRLSAAIRRCRFGHDENGATAIEFALLGPPFFAIIGAILETSVVLFSSQVLDSAVSDANRLIRTGQAQAAGYTQAQFKTAICGRLFGLFGDCSGLRVRVTQINDFASAQVTSPLQTDCVETCEWTIEEAFDPGKGSGIVVVQAYYKWPVILGYRDVGLADQPDGTRLLATVRVFRNEPF
jgi:Flp pilus assembly protein TadG